MRGQASPMFNGPSSAFVTTFSMSDTIWSNTFAGSSYRSLLKVECKLYPSASDSVETVAKVPRDEVLFVPSAYSLSLARHLRYKEGYENFMNTGIY